MKFNTKYDIEISKKGFINEIIQIDTRVPQEVISFGDEILWEPDIYIYKIMHGLNIEEFEMPHQYFP